MADAGLLRLSRSDIIFSCVDSDLARIEIVPGAPALASAVGSLQGLTGQSGIWRSRQWSGHFARSNCGSTMKPA
jgi:hypothetical protein